MTITAHMTLRVTKVELCAENLEVCHIVHRIIRNEGAELFADIRSANDSSNCP